MKKLSLMVLALFAIGAINAGAQDVRYNFAKDAKFSDYRTYKWVDIKGSEKVNELVQQQIKAALEKNSSTLTQQAGAWARVGAAVGMVGGDMVA